MNIHAPGSCGPSTTSVGLFDAPVMLRIDDEWVFVDDAAHALACIQGRFPKPYGPCCSRALATCEACLSGKLDGSAARAALVVAAMEAGFAFHVVDDPMEALERRAEVEIVAGLRATLLEPTS